MVRTVTVAEHSSSGQRMVCCVSFIFPSTSGDRRSVPRPREHGKCWRPLHAETAFQTTPGAGDRRGILESRAGNRASQPEADHELAPDACQPEPATPAALKVP